MLIELWCFGRWMYYNIGDRKRNRIIFPELPHGDKKNWFQTGSTGQRDDFWNNLINKSPLKNNINDRMCPSQAQPTFMRLSRQPFCSSINMLTNCKRFLDSRRSTLAFRLIFNLPLNCACFLETLRFHVVMKLRCFNNHCLKLGPCNCFPMTITVFWEGEKKKTLSPLSLKMDKFLSCSHDSTTTSVNIVFSSSKLDHPSSAQTYLQVIKGGGNRETDE